MNPRVSALYEATTQPFAIASRHAWHFARGKLRHDPVYFALLKQGILPDQGRMFDLGCGQGILLALIASARKQYEKGQWPEGWPAPPSRLAMHGVELMNDKVGVAHKAVADAARIEQGDIRKVNMDRCSAVVLLDVLHYLEADAQHQLLARIADALEPGGILLMREGNASAGIRFYLTQWAERIAGFAKGHLWQKWHYRSDQEWTQLLESLGFRVTRQPMSEGTPFSNVLFVAARPAG